MLSTKITLFRVGRIGSYKQGSRRQMTSLGLEWYFIDECRMWNKQHRWIWDRSIIRTSSIFLGKSWFFLKNIFSTRIWYKIPATSMYVQTSRKRNSNSVLTCVLPSMLCALAVTRTPFGKIHPRGCTSGRRESIGLRLFVVPVFVSFIFIGHTALAKHPIVSREEHLLLHETRSCDRPINSFQVGATAIVTSDTADCVEDKHNPSAAAVRVRSLKYTSSRRV